MAGSMRVAVIGGGISGICAGIYLKRFTNHDFRIFEQAADIGGTWRDNTYPGVECDVPSHLYSFSFELNPEWSHEFPTGAEIHGYLKRVVRKYDLQRHLVLNTGIRAGEYSDEGWRLTTFAGERHVADVVICGLGGLHVPKFPAWDDLETFEGPAFHTARWRHDVDLAGKDVAIFGTGATAVQCAPHVAARARRLHVFQRTPVWVGAKRNPPIPEDERALLRHDLSALRKKRWDLWKGWESTGLEMVTPGSAINVKAQRRAHDHLMAQVDDPALAAALTPGYNYTCKRPTISNEYYSMFNRANVELVSSPVSHVEPHVVVTADGRRLPLDVMIFATGFESFDITKEISLTGEDGLTLDEIWRDRIVSYRTVMAPKMPNLFMLLGPNSAGLTSTYQMIEAECAFVVKALKHLTESSRRRLSPKAEEVDRFCRGVQQQYAKTTQNKGCVSWWSDGKGYAHANWPSSSVEYRLMLQQFVPDHFEIH
jgi:cation diffusion facilitator CzcD-associated flavoprotein CzcO